MLLIQQWFKIRENSPHAIVTLLKLLNGSSLRLSIAGPESRHPKRDSDYGQKQKTKILKANNNKKFKPSRGKLQENLGCLPRSAMFNVVSSTTLNLNVLGNPSS